MRIASWEHYGLSYRRMLGISFGIGAGATIASYLLTSALLGEVSPLISGAVGVGFSYLAITAPKRGMQRSALAQAREAPVLAASTTVHLQTTGSRSKTLLTLRSQDDDMQRYLLSVRRQVMLGLDPRSAVQGQERRPASESVRRILQSLSESSSSRMTADSVELEGIQSASALGEETKVPVFVAVVFFTPIMLVLFSALSKNTGVFSLLSILFLQIIVLDLAYAISSSERQILGS